jgi:UDP-N-acetylglucosamine--N-acetylmuramyl-(pentapeptide) pyrophosphoryl-undecaprenol N-acetylglucosamine transferase
MVDMSKSPWIVIAGGGTAGHVLPALAIANALRSSGTPAQDIAFVGSKRGLEGRLVSEAGFPITLLSGRGIQRKFTLENVGALAGLVSGAVRAVALLARKRPAVVFSVGGYASTPCAFAARLLRIPLVQAESNARAGKAISTFAGYAKATAVQFDSTGLPNAELVGNPVRPEVLALFDDRSISATSSPEQRLAGHADRAVRQQQARGDLGYPIDQQLLAVFGGSLGARRINEAVFALAETWADRPISVHHVIGDRDFDSAQQWLNTWNERVPSRVLTYHQIRYEDRMDLVYSGANAFVCRAGGTSIADLAIAGVPAILVPLPSAAEDHQTANAQGVVADGGAVLVADRDCTAERLGQELSRILNDEPTHRAMAEAQLRRARPHAAASIVALLDRFASRPR